MRIYLIIVVLLIVITFSAHAQDDDAPLFPSDQDYFVEAFVSDPTPYVGEEIRYVMRYYSYSSIGGFIDLLPDFTGFWLFEAYELASPRIETVNNRQYNVQEVYGVIAPLSVGQVTIAPAILELPETVFRDAQIFQSNVVDVSVNPLPQPQPDGFAGAVGRFDMEMSIDRDTTPVGQPATLFLTIIGEGNLEQLRIPNLPELAGWRVYANSPELRTNTDAGLRLQEKTFSWLLIPDVTGTQIIPPIIFSYFDPQAEVYETLTGESFSVEVFPSPEGEQDRDIERILDANDLAVRVIPDQLNINNNRNRGGLLLWLLPLVLTSLIAIAVFGREYVNRRRIMLRQRNALKNSVSKLKAIHKLPPDEAFLTLKQIINQYLIDKQILNQSKMDETSNDHFSHLNGVNDATIMDLQQCLINADAGRYVPHSMRIDIKPLILKTVDVLETIDREWLV